eukprot:2248363-Rhodomonas_salina.2
MCSSLANIPKHKTLHLPGPAPNSSCGSTQVEGRESLAAATTRAHILIALAHRSFDGMLKTSIVLHTHRRSVQRHSLFIAIHILYTSGSCTSKPSLFRIPVIINPQAQLKCPMDFEHRLERDHASALRLQRCGTPCA